MNQTLIDLISLMDSDLVMFIKLRQLKLFKITSMKYGVLIQQIFQITRLQILKDLDIYLLLLIIFPVILGVYP